MQEHKTYVARRPECGHAMALILNNPEHARDVANEVAKCIRHGDTVELIDTEWVRQNVKLCDCKRKTAPVKETQ